MVYEELRSLASAYLRREREDHTLTTTALVHEAYLRLIDQRELRSGDREHFLAIAALAIRRILVDHARSRAAIKRGAQRPRITLTEDLVISENSALEERQIDLILLDEALEKLGGVDDRSAKVVEMRFFAGMTIEEVAHVLGKSTRTVNDTWKFARAWLQREMSRGLRP